MHSIRLRGFWEVTPGPTHTRHARNFGRPGTLGPGERVWLVCARVPGEAAVLLNGNPLPAAPAGPFAADVTDWLRPRNTVVFDVASGEPLGEVILEVREAA